MWLSCKSIAANRNAARPHIQQIGVSFRSGATFDSLGPRVREDDGGLWIIPVVLANAGTQSRKASTHYNPPLTPRLNLDLAEL